MNTNRLRAILIFSLVILILAVWKTGMMGSPNTSTVQQEEISATDLLATYRWCKETSVQLRDQQITIDSLNSQLTKMRDDHDNAPYIEWASEDQIQYATWQYERARVVDEYNSLAVEYNTQIAEVNFDFADANTLPPGISEPLPRFFRFYPS